MKRSYLIWSLAVTFLFYEFFIRVFPAAMVEELMAAFKVSARQLGTLSAFYFYAYAPMQIPVGLLMDRFGARKLLTFASFICGMGSLLFALANHLFAAEIGRFFMGVGSAFGFVGMVYVCSHWFPARQLALLVGLGNSIGMLGAVGAEGPLAASVSIFGWRMTLHTFALVGFILAAALYFCIRTEPKHYSKEKIKKASHYLLVNLKHVCSNHQTWINALIALLFYMTTAAFASLWGIPFLAEAYGLKKEVAGYIVSMIFVGWIVGGPLIGLISDRFSKRRPFLFFSVLLTGFALLPVIYLNHLPLWLLYVLLFCVGFFSSAQLLNFSLAIEFNPIEAKGTSIALTNFIVATGSSIMQPLLGWLLDLGWQGQMKEGIPDYSLANYKQAMISFPVTLLLAFLLLFFLKEKQQTRKPSLNHVGLD